MRPLSDPAWAELRHAYGSAADLPALLQQAAVDARPGHSPHSAWFALWSALCHQGDAYTASLAAVPHLVAMIPASLKRQQYDAVLLVASIEQARLEGRAPPLATHEKAEYEAAIAEARRHAEAARPWNGDAEQALAGSIAALRGDLAAARAIFDTELDEA